MFLKTLKTNFLKFSPIYFQSVKFLNYRPIETDNKIVNGHKLTQVIEKNRQKSLHNEFEKYKFKPTNTQSRLLISCSTIGKNHYAGQNYKNYTDQHCLASSNWSNRISNGKYFTLNPNGTHPSLTLNKQNDYIDFKDLNLNEAIINSLKSNFDIKKPTNIQCLTLNEFKKRQSHLLINAETGGGKTLAYLLPIIETCIQMKSKLNESNLKRGSNQPFAIIIVPTRELVNQIETVLNKLCNNEDYNDLKILADYPSSQIQSTDNQQPIDILITQPYQLKKRLEQNDQYFEPIYLKTVVLDEADTLLDDSFSELTVNCLQMLKLNLELNDKNICDLNCQLAFVSASVPRDLKNILKDLIDFEKVKHLTTNRTNRLLLVTPQRFFRMSADKRNAHLIELLQKELNNKACKRICMIFSHRTSTAVFVSKFLKENQIECELLTKNSENRESIVKRFFNKEIQILVCTDIASRGWDTTHVSHVINFEMPSFLADYLHRIGRVGRLGSVAGGLVTNYVTKAYETDLVNNIERSIRLNQDLFNVNANIKRFYKFKYSSNK
jgi:ATP-dependent RNA helicase DDX28